MKAQPFVVKKFCALHKIFSSNLLFKLQYLCELTY